MPPVKGALLSLGPIVSNASTATRRLFVRMFASKNSAPLADVGKHSGGQTFGITTRDALFKHVLSDDIIRSQFLNAFVPNLKIASSTRLDDHINPLMELQHLRSFVNKQDTAKTFGKIRADPGAFVVCKAVGSKLNNVNKADAANRSLNLIEDAKAMACLLEIAKHFDDLKSAFPQLKHNAKLDFVCKTDNGEYALVEMQVQAQDHWDQRALAYLAAFYGNQLRKGGQWNEIRKVIGINILGGGTDNQVHWRSTPDQYERHYKFQEQIHNWQPDAIIHSAAVGDFHVDRIEDSLGKTINPSKLDSSNGPYLVRFIAAPKLLDKIKGLWGYNGVLIGFKLESGLSDPHLWEEARKTCQRSGADLMVANHLENASSIAWIGPDKSGIFNVCPRKFLAFELIHRIEFLVSNSPKKK